MKKTTELLLMTALVLVYCAVNIVKIANNGWVVPEGSNFETFGLVGFFFICFRTSFFIKVEKKTPAILLAAGFLMVAAYAYICYFLEIPPSILALFANGILWLLMSVLLPELDLNTYSSGKERRRGVTQEEARPPEETE